MTAKKPLLEEARFYFVCKRDRAALPSAEYTPLPTMGCRYRFQQTFLFCLLFGVFTCVWFVVSF